MPDRPGWLAIASLGSCGLALTVCVACGSSSEDADSDATGPSYPPSDASGACDSVVQQHAIEGFDHIPVCSLTDYLTNPPSSGNHYPIWADYQTYTSPVPFGFLVHNLEHGAIVLSYNCAVGTGSHTGPSECDAEVAAAQQMINGLPVDQECLSLGQGVTFRAILSPDPDLDVRFAASAWGWTLRADCFDPDTFRAFAVTHYNQGREDICNDDEDPIAVGLPANCGTE